MAYFPQTIREQMTMSQQKLRVGINGLGRIGRTILRAYLRGDFAQHIEISAVNNPGDEKTYAHLLKYDSVHGVLPEDVRFENGSLIISGAKSTHTIPFRSEKNPEEIGWDKYGINLVIDATGIFKDKPGLSRHLGSTVKKVLMCAPGKDLDATFVYGINHNTYDPTKHHILSNASCTTNCLAPVAKILHEQWGIVSGFMTTVHAYTSDQVLLDGSHSDWRRARAAALSMIPTTTGAAKTVGLIIPELKGKLDGYAVRVPTPNVSQLDFTAILEKEATVETVNRAMKAASEGALKNILAYNDLELVSTDFLGRTESSLFDSTCTFAIGKHVKVVSWYDNEVGFSNRVLDLVTHIARS
jgi:glyceraldehyde 3-phosphate dehydrogenase